MSLSPAATAQAGVDTAWTEYEADLGDTAAMAGTFTLTDADIEATSKVLIFQAVGPYTGKGTLADEAQVDQVLAFAEPGDGEATVYWRALGGARVKGNMKFLYSVV